MKVLFKGFGLLAASAIVGGANAQVLNGGFEADGNFNTSITSWDGKGDAFTADASVFATPSEGTYQAAIASLTDGSYGEPAGMGVGSTVAEGFLGVSAGSLDAIGNGSTLNVSAIKQTVHLDAGQILVFDYNFLTDEVYKDAPGGPNEGFDSRPGADRNDFAFLTVTGAGGSSVQKLIDTFYGYSDNGAGATEFSTGLTPMDASDAFYSESGYLHGSYTATVAGDYTFGFGVTDAYQGGNPGQTGMPSALLVDNVRVVPEPATIATLGLGLAAVARRRKKA